MHTSTIVGIFFILIPGELSISATDIYREPWHWSSTIPASITPDKPRSKVRDRSTFERFRFQERTSMGEVVAALGLPHGFAAQFPVTMTEGVPVSHVHGGPEAGTFRYTLRDGSEYLITVTDFHTITAVTRYSRQVRDTIYTNQ